ncbi:hypothetical protein B0J11DRAFT_578469 [Dendryphion nanum]|uniref:Uncharacterized protein n=1 Tax=Dendryphion nanum TaxID=256645 RepID=A0A9P9IPX2_9PLEO|nr:hypothetical protein B0J11DRAFT_578469 [Dendryphion nanum]
MFFFPILTSQQAASLCRASSGAASSLHRRYSPLFRKIITKEKTKDPMLLIIGDILLELKAKTLEAANTKSSSNLSTRQDKPLSDPLPNQPPSPLPALSSSVCSQPGSSLTETKGKSVWWNEHVPIPSLPLQIHKVPLTAQRQDKVRYFEKDELSLHARRPPTLSPDIPEPPYMNPYTEDYPSFRKHPYKKFYPNMSQIDLNEGMTLEDIATVAGTESPRSYSPSSDDEFHDFDSVNSLPALTRVPSRRPEDPPSASSALKLRSSKENFAPSLGTIMENASGLDEGVEKTDSDSETIKPSTTTPEPSAGGLSAARPNSYTPSWHRSSVRDSDPTLNTDAVSSRTDSWYRSSNRNTLNNISEASGDHSAGPSTEPSPASEHFDDVLLRRFQESPPPPPPGSCRDV